MPRTTDPARGTLPYSTVHLLGRGYQPVPAETDHTGLTVRGTLPSQLDGTFLRIGPHARGPHDPAVDHALSDGMVHAIRLGGGRALSYRNRWLRTDAISGALNELPTPDPVADRTATSTPAWSGTPAAPWPWPPPPPCRSSSTPASPPVPAPTSTAPSPAVCARTPSPTRSPANSSRSRPTTRGTRRSCSPSTPRAGSAKHCRSRSRAAPGCTPSPSPSATRSSSTCRLPTTPPRRRAGSPVPYSWQHDHGARVGIVPRGGTEAAAIWLDVAPCFVFHPVNAHEEETAGSPWT